MAVPSNGTLDVLIGGCTGKAAANPVPDVRTSESTTSKNFDPERMHIDRTEAPGQRLRCTVDPGAGFTARSWRPHQVHTTTGHAYSLPLELAVI